MKEIIVTQSFNCSRKVIWDAITTHDQMIQWFFENIPSFRPEEGFHTKFVVEHEGRTFTHLWTILEVIPEKKIVYDWRYKEYPGIGQVIFELSDYNGLTQLTLTNHGLETFPKDIEEFKEESCKAGWNYFINQRLREFIEKS